MGDCSAKQKQKDRKICLQFKTRGERKATKGDKRRRLSRIVMGMKEESGGKKVDHAVLRDLHLR